MLEVVGDDVPFELATGTFGISPGWKAQIQ
jgi:hypothetical protein